MSLYQGRALDTRAPRSRPTGRLKRIGIAFGVLVALTALAHVPWGPLRARVVALRDVRVKGLHYLDQEKVVKISGVKRGQDLLALDPRRVRQALLLHPRIERAEVSRRFPHGIEITVLERVPAMLVRHGLPWEMDSTGVLLEPLSDGVVADVPMLSGVSFEKSRDGTRIATPEVRRGLAWVKALAASELQLLGQVSEIDVGDARLTGLMLMNGTRVLSPPWPPGTRKLSALRVVLEDLRQKGTLAREVDLRFEDQVIVRPVETTGPMPATAEAAGAHGTS